MPTELKHCPFCRGPAEIWDKERDLATCPVMDCAGWRTVAPRESWNRRAPTPEGEALRELIDWWVKLRAHWKKIEPEADAMTTDMYLDRGIIYREHEAILARHGIQLPAEEGENVER